MNGDIAGEREKSGVTVQLQYFCKTLCLAADVSRGFPWFRKTAKQRDNRHC